MAGLPTQSFIQAGVNLDALASVTRLQLLQAINEANPLSNIGFIVSFAGNGVTWPSTGNNPEFARFLWEDTTTNPPVIKAWDPTEGDTYDAWVAVSLGPDSIEEVNIAEDAVTLLDADGSTWKCCYKHDGSAGVGRENNLLKLDASGDKVVVDSLANVLTPGSVPKSSLNPGIDNQFLRMNGSVWEAETINFAAELADASVPVSKLAPTGGAAKYIVRVNSAGTALELVSNNDSVSDLIAARSLVPSKISVAGASSGHLVRFNGTDWATSAPGVDLARATDASNVGIESDDALTEIDHTIPHGLGGKPRMLRVVLLCITSQAGIDSGDELEISSIGRYNGGADNANGSPYITVSSDEDNVYITRQAATAYLTDRASGGLTIVLNGAFWKYKVYAWA